MKPVLAKCPVCGGELAVTRLHCRSCGTTLEGQFEVVVGPFGSLSPEQLDFLWAFVRCEGKFTRMEKEMGLSYPTLRSRLHDILRGLGVEPGLEEASAGPSEEARRQVLADLEQGRITADDAIAALRGGKE